MGFNEVLEKVKEKSIELGVYPLGIEEAQILYAIIFIYSIFKNCIKIVNIGTNCGYSILWMAKAIRDSGTDECSVIIGIEKDSQKVKIVREFIELTRFSYFTKVFESDVYELLNTMVDLIDIVLIDICTIRDLQCIKTIYQKLKPGGLLITYNIFKLPKNYVDKLFKEIHNSRKWVTTIIATKSGLSISIKK